MLEYIFLHFLIKCVSSSILRIMKIENIISDGFLKHFMVYEKLSGFFKQIQKRIIEKIFETHFD